MGNYNPQYRDYYNSMLNKNNNYSPYYGSNNKKSNFIVKRITIDLIGVLALFIVVTFCKLVVTPNTQKVYEYSKKIVNENYDYKKAISTVKSFKFNDVKEKSEDYIEKVVNKINGKRSIKDMVKSEYTLPCIGTVTSEFGERVDPFSGKKQMHKGVDIAVKENTPIKACSYGKVKECGEFKDLGKYIVIDHGKGIETKYAHLKELKVKKNQMVKKGEEIGRSGNTGKSTGPHLHLEIMFMGESKNPKEFFEKLNIDK